MSDLPPNWIVRESKSHPGKPYYYNTVTQESVWEKPTSSSSAGSFSSQTTTIEPTQVRASHILCKHIHSRRPASWRCDNITLTKEEALKELENIREKIVNGTSTFEEIAKVRSDCSSAKQNGDLGFFARGQMQKPFENATFSLKIGELSGIVDTDSGVHIILRTG
jgi:NIMA-interacting peptidyl-prolyl cis-trans isomerase 1